MRAAAGLSEPRFTPVRVVPVVALAALAVVALDRAADPPVLEREAPPPVAAADPDNASYDAVLARYDRGVAAAAERAGTRADEWLIQEQYARALFARGRLTGSYDDYAAAQAALDRAFRDAPAGAGPHQAQATLHLLMHRLGAAEEMLDALGRYAVPPDRGELAEIAGMRGDVAFYRGDYAAALSRYDEADRILPGAADFRRAIYLAKTGRPDLAEAKFDSYERGLRRPGRQLRANLQLQRGILDLDHGRWNEALAHFRRADALFPGWWLVQEHIAETTALLGDHDGAERLYRGIIARTGSPEFMDALAKLLLARGEIGEAEQLRRRSWAIWEVRLRQFPEASYGHALDHCVAFRDHGCALDLAQRNFAARPYGEAGEKLAVALLDNGRASEARTIIDAVLAGPWRTPITYAAAERIYRALGDGVAADRWRAEALRLHPRIFG